MCNFVIVCMHSQAIPLAMRKSIRGLGFLSHMSMVLPLSSPSGYWSSTTKNLSMNCQISNAPNTKGYDLLVGSIVSLGWFLYSSFAWKHVLHSLP